MKNENKAKLKKEKQMICRVVCLLTILNFILYINFFFPELFKWANDVLAPEAGSESIALIKEVEVEKVYAYNEQVPIEVVKAEIIKQAKVFGNNVEFMLNLANCESTFNNLAENKKSSAEGVYQWLYGSWRETRSGKKHISRFDYRANILQANIAIASEEYFRWAECLEKYPSSLIGMSGA